MSALHALYCTCPLRDVCYVCAYLHVTTRARSTTYTHFARNKEAARSELQNEARTL